MNFSCGLHEPKVFAVIVVSAVFGIIWMHVRTMGILNVLHVSSHKEPEVVTREGRIYDQRGHDFNRNIIRNNITILVLAQLRWMGAWVADRWETSDMFKSCPVSNCILSQKISMDNADAVLFRGPDVGKCWKKEKLGQVWMYLELEHPERTFYNRYRPCQNNLFNWTFTMRRDSDFPMIHGYFSKRTTNYDETILEQHLATKNKTAVGFISHCGAHSERETFIRALRSQGVDIDIYGKCGNLKCGGATGTRWKPTWNITENVPDNCFDVLDSRYRFYLSFENALCEDYVTEKSLHLVLRHNIVPIIRDGVNHSLYHPPHSYIDTKNFKDVKSLAKYIKYLTVNKDAYKQYFKWRHHFSSTGTMRKFVEQEFCNMCKRLNNPEKYRRLYANLGKFIQTKSEEKRVCRKPNKGQVVM